MKIRNAFVYAPFAEQYTALVARMLFTLGLLAGMAAATVPGAAWGQIEFDKEPINYSEAPTDNPVSRLQQQLDAGDAKLEHDDEHGYLTSLLRLLEVPSSSQVLVKSKTSFQLRRISPRTPRALYFNDESYVGWCQQGDVIEVMTTDPKLGEVFYTLSQEDEGKPKFIRDRGQCITCHASSRTQGVPGGLVRSVFVDAGGQPHFGAGTFNIDHTSPFKDRWGGWYVSGTHGQMRHMGNVISKDRHNPEAIDREDGANVTRLSDRLDTAPYVGDESDIVALMVLEHQTQMQNFLTLAHYDQQLAAHYDGIMNKALDRPDDFVSETTERRTKSVGDKVLRYMLFCDEFQLTAPVKGVTTFTQEYQSQGPRDGKGRSLRDLDLQTRLFKYRCSPMIYTPSFEKLPPAVKQYIADRLHKILTGADTDAEFAHLEKQEREAILEILTDTLPDLWSR